jgi:hypothetical protein
MIKGKVVLLPFPFDDLSVSYDGNHFPDSV